MKPSGKIPLGLRGVFLGVSMMTNAALAQNNFTVLEQVIAGGGVTISRGGNFTLSGTFGQPAAGTLRGGNFVLAGGFWGAAVAVQQAGMPRLRIANAQFQIVVAWEFGGDDVEIVLEQSASLGAGAEWSAVVLQREVVEGEVRVRLPANSANHFFRLRRPDLIP